MMIHKLRRLLGLLRVRFASTAIDDDDVDQLQSWSISAQLAAVPPGYEKEVPREVAALIRAAKRLHPQMALGALDRERRGEPCPELGWTGFEGHSAP